MLRSMLKSQAILGGMLVASWWFSAPLQAQDVEALKQQARAIFKQGQYAQAIAAFEKAVAAANRSYGPNDQRTDVLVNELALAFYKQGRLAEAAANYRRVLANTEARPAENREYDTATCLTNLAAVMNDAGEYEQAEALHERSYEVMRAKYGADSAYLATNLNNWATLHRSLGDDARALDYFQQALKLYEKSTPRDEVLIATTLHNLAGAQHALGQFDKADALYRQALAMREAKLGAQHPAVATTLNSLASVQKDLKQFAQAEELYKRGLQLRIARLGKDHPDVATSLSNLASLYSSQHRYDEAQDLNHQVLAIREAKLGPEHPSVAITLNNLAVVYQNLNQDDKAEPLFEKALAIRTAKNGPNHPEVAQGYKNMALLHAKLGQWQKASDELDQTRRIVRRHANQILPVLSEADQLTFLKFTDEDYLHIALSLGLAQSGDQAIVDRTAEWLLNAKGVAQQAMTQRQVLNRDLKDPQIGPQVKKLQELRAELAFLQRGGANAEDAARRERIESLREQELQLAKQIAATSGRPVQDGEWVSLADVRQALPAGEMLVQIARFRVRNFAALKPEERWLPPRYVAWIVPPTGKQAVTLVDLGPGEAIEAAVRTARQALVKAPELIQQHGDAEAEQALLGPLGDLAKLILVPLLKPLGKAERVLLSPDASLWLVPWAALPLGKKYAVETFELGYVVSGRDVFAANLKPHVGPPIIFANPDYNLGVKETLAAIETVFPKGSAPIASTIRSATALGKVLPLPGTAVEADVIRPKLTTFAGSEPQTFMGAYALEGAIRSVRPPRVLILSTHGYFQEDQHAENIDDDAARPRPGKRLENPLLRCGLLLAGCNTRELAGRKDADDGVLTGQEIVGIDLRGTELVVLSACQTGLGEVRNGEGVAGLRHAFQLAGARSVMATLWEIPDAQTAKLMSDFFGELAEGKSRPAALRAAQLALIAARRDRRGAAHPFFWAAFTITGTP